MLANRFRTVILNFMNGGANKGTKKQLAASAAFHAAFDKAIGWTDADRAYWAAIEADELEKAAKGGAR